MPLTRTLVIGDIHGCLKQLDMLLDTIAPSSADHLVFLGDLVDRGLNSSGVLRRVRSLFNLHHVTVIKGNHEQLMLDARESREKFADWLRNGGDATLRFYAGVRATLRDVPSEDWQFLSTNLVNYFETDTHIFVHASASPDLPMDAQSDYTLQWERCHQMAPHCSGKTIICGHTHQNSGKPLNLGFGVCLDTHAHGGGPLTCMDTESGEIWQAMANGKVQRSHLAEYEG